MSYDTRNEGSSSGTRQEPRPDHTMNLTARNEQGQFVSLNKDRQLDNTRDNRDEMNKKEGKENSYENKPYDKSYEKPYEKPYEKFDKTGNGDMSNMLRHIEQLERRLQQRDGELNDAKSRVEKFSQRTREGMQSALDSLMKKWMDAVETKDPNVKDEFKGGLERLVKNSAEDNGVWQMMVSASSLYQRQEHDLESLRVENTELRTKVNGLYGEDVTRTVGSKSKADTQLGPADVMDGMSSGGNMWDSFAMDIGRTSF